MNFCFYGRIGPGSLSWTRLAYNIIYDFLSSSVTFHPRTLICCDWWSLDEIAALRNTGTLIKIVQTKCRLRHATRPDTIPASWRPLCAQTLKSTHEAFLNKPEFRSTHEAIINVKMNALGKLVLYLLIENAVVRVFAPVHYYERPVVWIWDSSQITKHLLREWEVAWKKMLL